MPASYDPEANGIDRSATAILYKGHFQHETKSPWA